MVFLCFHHTLLGLTSSDGLCVGATVGVAPTQALVVMGVGTTTEQVSSGMRCSISIFVVAGVGSDDRWEYARDDYEGRRD